MRKEGIARDEQFLLLPQCFLSFQRIFRHFHEILSCRLQTLSVLKGLESVVWEGVKMTKLKRGLSQQYLKITYYMCPI